MDNHPVETNFSLGSGGGGHHVRPTEKRARQGDGVGERTLGQ